PPSSAGAPSLRSRPAVSPCSSCELALFARVPVPHPLHQLEPVVERLARRLARAPAGHGQLVDPAEELERPLAPFAARLDVVEQLLLGEKIAEEELQERLVAHL